jgi:hypothetical protein
VCKHATSFRFLSGKSSGNQQKTIWLAPKTAWKILVTRKLGQCLYNVNASFCIGAAILPIISAFSVALAFGHSSFLVAPVFTRPFSQSLQLFGCSGFLFVPVIPVVCGHSTEI